MTSTAEKYDFEYFQNNEIRNRSKNTNLKVVTGGKVKHDAHVKILFKAVDVFAVVFMLSLVIVFLQGRVKITELTSDINNQQEEMASAKSEYSYLKNKIDEYSNLSNVQDAANRFGMMQTNAKQITYVGLNEATGAEISTQKIGIDKLLDNVKTCFIDIGSDIIEQLDP